MSEPLGSYPNVLGEPLLVVLSGPSGVGKDVALSQLRTLERPWHFVVTATTRPRRPNETDGLDYVFLSPQEFETMVEGDEFLEHAQVYSNRYGVPRKQVRDAMSKGHDVIMKVDVQGAATIKKLAPEAVFIFMAPYSMDELARRLTERATESAMDLKVRTSIARQEMERADEFDYVVINRDGCLDQAVTCIDAVILAEKCRLGRGSISI